MAEEHAIRITTPGADAAAGKLRDVAAAQAQTGRSAEDAGRKAEGAYDRAQRRLRELTAAQKNLRYAMDRGGRVTDAQRRRMERLSRATTAYRGRLGEVDRATAQAATTTQSLGGHVSQLAQAYLGMRVAFQLVSSLREETEKTDEATLRIINSLRSVLALSALKGERPETQKSIYQMAVAAGRKVDEVAPAYYTLLGGTAGMDRDRQMGLMQQALTMAKTDPTASLDSLVNLFSTIAAQQPGLTPLQIGNLASKAIEQAKSTTGEMSQYLPDVLTAAQAGGADVGTATAMFTFATRKGGGVAKAGQSAKSALLGLLAPNDQAARQLREYGFPGQGDLMTKVQWLAEKGESLPPELQAALGGRRGIQSIAAIAAAPEEFAAEREIIGGSLTAEGSLLKERLRDMYGEVPAQRMLDQFKQIEVMRDIEYVDEDALWEKSAIDMVDLILKRQGTSPVMRDLTRWWSKTSRYIGGPPWPANTNPSQVAFLELLREGYTPQQLIEHALPAVQEGGGGIEVTREGLRLENANREEVEAEKQRLREVLSSAGVTTMQGTTYNGGTHIHQHDRTDPAGRPLPPRGQ